MPKTKVTERDPLQKESMLSKMAWDIIARNPQMEQDQAFKKATKFVELQDRRMKRLIEMENAKFDAELEEEFNE